MSDQDTLFRPRKFGTSESAAFVRKSFLADSTAEAPSFSGLTNIGVYAGEELTKNDKFCVSRLPASPPILSKDFMSESSDLLNGYSDNVTKCALVIGDHAINVWPYKSTDDVPITFEFPLLDGNQDAVPLAILTRPTPGSTIDPGLVIINSLSGYVRFYESVQHAPALGLINSKLIEATIPIQMSKGEVITVAENVEPAGVVVATSWKRVVLILLRDFNGAPKLSLVELSAPAKSFKLLPSWLKRSDPDQLSDEIVSIKTGRVASNGLAQEIIIQDAAGIFKKILFQFSATGSPRIDHRKTLTFSLASYLENNIDGFIPGAVINVRYLDLWPLRPHGDIPSESQLFDDLYTALICVESSLHGRDEKRLLLITMRINDSGVMVYGSHQLPKVDSALLDSLIAKPRLFIPSPGVTAFVVVGTTIILTDMNTSFLKSSSQSSFLYFNPKWEDNINLKSSVDVIGLGYEDKVGETNPSLVLITRDFGVLRVERFTDKADSSPNSIEDMSTDPVYLLKSHVQQAIYYHESSVVNFDVGSEYNQDTINAAVRIIVSEILDSSSPYLPPIFPSTRESFSVRTTLMRHLISYVQRNFADSWSTIVEIAHALEKLSAAENLWNYIDVDTPDASILKEKLVHFIVANDLTESTGSKDTLRIFFTKSVDKILFLLTGFVESLHQENYSKIVLLKILEITLHDAVFLNEELFVTSLGFLPMKNWIFDSKLLIIAESIYSEEYCSSSGELKYLSSSQSQAQLAKLTESLYYLVTSAVTYMKETHDDQLSEYLEWYNDRKKEWVGAMLKHGLVNDALRITEKFKDFLSIAAVLEKERNQTSPEYIEERIRIFMEKYGYDFATELFNYYLETDKIHRLVVECGPYQNFLETYFDDNASKSAKVAWIHYLLVNNFDEAAKRLMTVSSSNEMDNQESRELNLSLAKLTAIAAKFSRSDGFPSPTLDEIAIEAENSLVVTRIQNNLFNSIALLLQGQKSLIKLDWFLSNFSNPAVPVSEIREEVLPFFDRFVNQNSLEKPQLVSILTSIKPINEFKRVFADALMVAALIGNDEVFKQQAHGVWLKLLTVTDDWKSITFTSDATDDVSKDRITQTVLFHTMKLVATNREIMHALDTVIDFARSGQYPEGSTLFESLAEMIKNNNLASWVDSIKAGVR